MWKNEKMRTATEVRILGIGKLGRGSRRLGRIDEEIKQSGLTKSYTIETYGIQIVRW